MPSGGACFMSCFENGTLNEAGTTNDPQSALRYNMDICSTDGCNAAEACFKNAFVVFLSNNYEWIVPVIAVAVLLCVVYATLKKFFCNKR